MARPESALVALALLLATTPAHPQPLLGTWVYPSRDVMWELEIGTDAYDDIEGVVCGKNDADGSIWGVRLETIARADEEGNRIRIKNSFLSLSLGLRNPDTIVMQVMDPKKPHKGTINTFDVKRSERTRCTHRFRSAKGPEDHDRLSTGSIVGEWSISRSGVSFAELAIEEIKGRHVLGRMCSRKSNGTIFLFDLYKGGPHRARYDPSTQTLRVVEKRRDKESRTHEFTRTDDDEMTRTLQGRTETMRRGRQWGGCLARTNERPH